MGPPEELSSAQLRSAPPAGTSLGLPGDGTLAENMLLNEFPNNAGEALQYYDESLRDAAKYYEGLRAW